MFNLKKMLACCQTGIELLIFYSQCNKKQGDDSANSQQERDEVNGQVMSVYSFLAKSFLIKLFIHQNFFTVYVVFCCCLTSSLNIFGYPSSDKLEVCSSKREHLQGI